MSDYNSLRLKRNAELQNAMANVRKDLYDWKPQKPAPKNNVYKLVQPPLRLKSLDSMSGGPFTLKHTESVENIGSKIRNLNIISGRPQSAEKSLKNNIKNVKKFEFLASFNDNTTLNLDHEEKVYLTSARNNNNTALNMAPKRNQKELETELVRFQK